jgi:excisionase family DNA binding protein
MEGSSYSLSKEAAVLGVSVPTVRALVARGQLASFRTPGGHLRIPSESVAAYRDGRPNRTNPPNTTSTALQGRRDNLESLRLETEELRVRRDLRKIQEEEQEVENRRKAEAQATALCRKEERERRRAEIMRETDARRQETAEAEAIRRRHQWEIGWTDFALWLLPKDTPQSLELDVHQAVPMHLLSSIPISLSKLLNAWSGLPSTNPCSPGTSARRLKRSSRRSATSFQSR